MLMGESRRWRGDIITMQYSAAQYNIVQYSTVHYSALQYSTVQYSSVQESTVPYNTTQRNRESVVTCYQQQYKSNREYIDPHLIYNAVKKNDHSTLAF